MIKTVQLDLLYTTLVHGNDSVIAFNAYNFYCHFLLLQAFLMVHRSHVAKLLGTESVLVTQITGNNMYPIINKERGSDYALKFVKGLCFIGLGRIEKVPRLRHGVFKRYHPNDEECPQRDTVKQIWEQLDLSFD